MENNKDNIYSEDANEILDKMPNWFVRRGITIIFFLIIVLSIVSNYIRYPDVINSSIIITSENPPVNLISYSNSKIEKIFFKEEDLVYKNSVIAVLKNDANYSEVLELSNIIDSLKFEVFDSIFMAYKFKEYSLGIVQDKFIEVENSIKEIQSYLNNRKNDSRVKIINRQIATYRNMYSKVNEQKKLVNRELFLQKKRFRKDSILYKNRVIAEDTYDKSSQDLISKEYQLQGISGSLSQSSIQMANLEKNLNDVMLQNNSELQDFKNDLSIRIKQLKSTIMEWKNKYVIQAPIEGHINLFNLHLNQDVKTDEVLSSIIPITTGVIYGKIKISQNGAAKVKQNQVVKIKLNDYPFQEFGVIYGSIISISNAKKDSFYYAQVKINNSLITSLNKKIIFRQEMEGLGQIVTDDISLFNRTFSKLNRFKSN